MIDPKAEPIDHRPPYKRIDLARRRMREVITIAEIYREEIFPDTNFYEWFPDECVWKLKRH